MSLLSDIIAVVGQLDSSSTKNINSAILNSKKEFPKIEKDSINTYFNSSYAKLESILNSIEPVLHKHGCQIRFKPLPMDKSEVLQTIVVHESGEFISTLYTIISKKENPQEHGSALTYAKKQSISALLALSTEEDDDGRLASISDKKITSAGFPVDMKKEKKQYDGKITKKQKDMINRIVGEMGYSLPELKNISDTAKKLNITEIDRLSLKEASSIIGELLATRQLKNKYNETPKIDLREEIPF